MPILQQINLRSFSGPNGDRRKSVSMGFSFAGETPEPTAMGPITLTGASFTLDVSALVAGFSMGPVRTLQLTSKYLIDITNTKIDGSLYIFCPQTNHFLRLSATGSESGAASIVAGILTAVVPVVTTTGSKIIISKEVANDGILHGDIYVTAFDFDLPAYTNQGITYYVS